MFTIKRAAAIVAYDLYYGNILLERFDRKWQARDAMSVYQTLLGK